MYPSLPQPAGREHSASWQDRPTWRPRILCTVLSCCLVVSVLVACGQSQSSKAPSPTPSPIAGWHSVAPPWHGVASDTSLERYVVSRDVSGLIVACNGQSTSPPNQGLSGTAHLWRSRDGGSHWQALATTISLSSCGALTFIAGSSGLLVSTGSIEAGSGTGTLLVSPDAGDTWKTVSRFFPQEIAANRFTAMQQAVYRDSKLYASLIFNASIERRFSVSNDYGVTWTQIEQVPPHAPNDIAVVTEHFAPDYRTPHAWFRYALHGPLDVSLPHYTTLDRSTDDGRTWTPLTRLETDAAELPQYGRALVTSPQQPSRLCVGLNIQVRIPSEQLPESDLLLGASDDAGATWHYTRISHIQEDGRSGSPEPLMDARGACYVSVEPSGVVGAGVPSTESTLLRLGPGDRAQPEVIATLKGQVAGVVAVFATSQPNQLQLSVVSVPIPTGKPINYNMTNLLVDTLLD